MRVLGERRRILTQSRGLRRANAHARLPACNRRNEAYKSLQGPGQQPAPSGRFWGSTSKKEQIMKTSTFHLLSLAGLAVSALAASVPALAHDGYFYGHGHYGRPHFAYPGQRVVVVRPPVFVHRPLVVYRPGPVYYAPAPAYYAAPAPVYYAQPWGTIGGAIAGAAIGSIAGDGRPGAIAAGSVIRAVVGSGLAR